MKDEINFWITIATFIIALITFIFFMIDRKKQNQTLKYKLEQCFLQKINEQKYYIVCCLSFQNITNAPITLYEALLFYQKNFFHFDMRYGPLPKDIGVNLSINFELHFELNKPLNLRHCTLSIKDSTTRKPCKIKLKPIK